VAILSGYGWKWDWSDIGGKPGMRERYSPGAFAEYLRAGVTHLWVNHRRADFRISSGEAFRLSEDSAGLRFAIVLTGEAGRVIEECWQAGRIYGVSISTGCERATTATERGWTVRTIHACTLPEISLCVDDLRPRMSETRGTMQLAYQASDRSALEGRLWMARANGDYGTADFIERQLMALGR
jgi:HK97 family phage prohead protease